MSRRRKRGWWLSDAPQGPRQRRARVKGGLTRSILLSPERREQIASAAGRAAGRVHRAKRLARMVRKLKSKEKGRAE